MYSDKQALKRNKLSALWNFLTIVHKNLNDCKLGLILKTMRAQVHDIYQTKPADFKKIVAAFYVSTLSTNEKSSHWAAAGRKWEK